MKRMLVAGMAAGMLLTAQAQVTAPSEVAVDATPTESEWFFDGGIDFRLRYESFDNIPQGPLVGDFSYFRFRTRPWLRAGTERASIYVRGAHRMHGYFGGNYGYKYPDEFIIDNLYLDVNDLFDGRVDLRIGRQDLIYGAGRLILEGTSGDGARTIYFDAVKAVITLRPDTTLDVFAIYNDYENNLALGNVDRDLTRYTGGLNEMKEIGAGLYLKNKTVKDMPFEAYYIWKRESRYLANGFLPTPKRDVHTVGTRLLPKFSDKLSGEVEIAGQMGEVDNGQDILGMMAYAGLTYQMDPVRKAKPYLTGSVYFMSGDDSNNGDDHRWNPLWARYPQFHELTVYSFQPQANGQTDGMWRWSNIIYPAVEIGITTDRKDKASLQTGPLFADESDGVSGHYRGWIATACYKFPIIANLLGESYGGRGVLTGKLYGECLVPGNYYASDKTAWFMRVELNASF